MSGMVRDVETAVTDMKTSCDPPWRDRSSENIDDV
jgi:hypothetical protein